MNNRFKEIREYYNLSQEELGNRVKIKRSHVSSLENGARTLTNRVISDICREFNVNESWLRTGEGEMFIEIPQEDEYFKAATQISKNNDELAMNMIIEYWKLDEMSKKVFRKYITSVANNMKGEQD